MSDICQSERVDVNKLHDLQSGDNWTCMWLNHFNREHERLNRIQDKYAKNTQRIINNPDLFGSIQNNVSECKKQQLQSMQINGG